MSDQLAAAFHSIDPVVLGTRIRNARTLAGKTQADLAADEVTAAYLSRIESGQRKPDFHLLSRIADRANTTLAALLAPESRDPSLEVRVKLDYAELALASGQAAEALEQVDRILPELQTQGSTDSLSRAAHRVRARALEATGRLDEAIVLLEDLTGEAPGDLGWLQDLIALSRCYRESGDLDRAIATGEHAEASIKQRGLAGLTEAIQLTITVSGAYLQRGDLDHAMRLCMRAAEAADKHHAPVARGSAYWGASLIESRRGNHQDALDLARKAIAFFEVSDDARNLGRLRAQIAIIQLKLNPPDAHGALTTLDRAKNEMDWAPASSIDHGREQLTRAKAHFLLGHHDEANTFLASCLDLLPESAVFPRASCYALAAQIALATGEQGRARHEMTAAVQVLSAVGADREAAQLWYELGSMLEQLGDTTGALDAFRRAAASTGLYPQSVTPLSSATHGQTHDR